MPDEPNEPAIHIDSDWKAEAQREKEELLEQEQKKEGAGSVQTDPAFADLLNMLAMQIAISLGGYQGPGGEAVPADLGAARQQIAMLEALERKTRNNVSDEERRGLSELLHGLRMQYVKLAQGGRPPGDGTTPGPQQPDA